MARILAGPGLAEDLALPAPKQKLGFLDYLTFGRRSGPNVSLRLNDLNFRHGMDLASGLAAFAFHFLSFFTIHHTPAHGTP